MLSALLHVVRLVRLAYLVCRPRFLRGFIVSVVSRSVAGSVVADSVRIPGRYRTPIPRTLLVVAVLVVAAVASLVFGSYQMSPDQVFRLIFQGEGTEIERHLVLNQRLPRMLAAVVVGAALGLSGAIFQSVSRNALGSPDIIGFTVGSATGALSVVLIGSLSSTGVGMGLGAIIGGFATAAVVMLLAGVRGGATMGQKMVLIGIAVSAMLSSVNDYLITRGDLEKAEAAKTWQHGSLNALSWNQMSVQAVLLLVAIPLVLMLTHRLRVLELGDDLAAGLGLPVKRTVNMLVAAAVLLVAVAISVAGPIGFLALVAPQIARRLWNTPGMAMWHSALLGSVILVLADFVSARALAPFQIPVGLVTGALGGVYMLWLLYRQR